MRDFWEEEPCGSEHAGAPEGSPEFFAEVEQTRAELDPYIARFADFEGAKGKRFLEIGVGLGTDFIRFVRAGASATGVDLTEHAVQLVRRRLELEGLQGEVVVADAETLPFEDGSFDRVYSWGVLHHTPDTGRAVREAIRVTKPGGRGVRDALRAALVGRLRHVGAPRAAGGQALPQPRGVLSAHMESEGTKGYTKREMRGLFSGLEKLRIDKVRTSYDDQIAGPLARMTGNLLGWNLVARGQKPTASRAPRRTGQQHLAHPARTASVASPRRCAAAGGGPATACS